ncbi:MAG: cupin [Actinobacteria bacterium]|nr:cupin [Actinomycetota bacterium]NIS31476.1 cupin [Actinomycetota bacterium]NIT95709.1 cupin [Actinomycetota bacterium]NIU19395.1 cupin [Actinomycetota bacterium]NIU66594.1 cupin [Actinomycetota bacterium]
MDDGVFDLATTPLHLGLGAAVVVLPPFTGDPSWYERYGEMHAADGFEGRLVSLHTFEASWDSWEVHPNGAEVVICVAGRMTLHQEEPDGTTRTVVLEEGQGVINQPGVWHTADVASAATGLFITAGLGTEHRPR